MEQQEIEHLRNFKQFSLKETKTLNMKLIDHIEKLDLPNEETLALIMTSQAMLLSDMARIICYTINTTASTKENAHEREAFLTLAVDQIRNIVAYIFDHEIPDKGGYPEDGE